jgi:acetyl esterase/lipase
MSLPQLSFRAAVLLFGGVLANSARAEAVAPAITADVIYGHKAGMALTYDVVKADKPNGAAVLFMVSGGWVSNWEDPAPLVAKAVKGKDHNGFGMLLDHGFTLLLVRHGSSPYFRVPDAVEDVRRAVRHVRLNAATMGIDPKRLGVFGGSAGGHLSLMLGTASDAGNASSADALEKTPDSVAAVVAYFPPTDLTDYIGDKRFPALHFPAEKAESVSPLRQVSAEDAPTLLVHGGKDTLVPISHSQNILTAFQKAGVPVDLVTFAEAGHGFGGADEKAASTAMVAWFEKYLTAAKPVELAISGIWEAKATMPDGGVRPSTLTVSGTDGQYTATVDGELGEKKIDRVKLVDGHLLMEFDMERDGRKGTIKVDATSASAGQLAGTWSVHDDEGQTLVSGPWEARQKPAVN